MTNGQLTKILDEMDLPRVEVARVLGVTRQRLNEYERGERKMTGTVAAHVRTLAKVRAASLELDGALSGKKRR